VQEKIILDDNALAQKLYGQGNEHLKQLEKELDVAAHTRGNELTLVGETFQVNLARALCEQFYRMLKRGTPLSAADVTRAAAVLREKPDADLSKIFEDTVIVSARARAIAPKGLNQKAYVDAIRSHDVVFGIGPAGTGKTYLAMAMAIKALLAKQIQRIVLCRPAVEAGEKLGFLPGTMEEKVNPYLRPLYDALQDMMDIDRAQQLIERGVIEVAPLAFMRGRTLNASFVILDEAQNTTSEQMKMFLTRQGYDSKAVITGDVTQTDLPGGVRSGLKEAREILANVPGIAFCQFTQVDVVRHPLVQRIIGAYEAEDERKKAAQGNL
jgi:phosphate starvation-inducible PhoH-like protein